MGPNPILNPVQNPIPKPIPNPVSNSIPNPISNPIPNPILNPNPIPNNNQNVNWQYNFNSSWHHSYNYTTHWNNFPVGIPSPSYAQDPQYDRRTFNVKQFDVKPASTARTPSDSEKPIEIPVTLPTPAVTTSTAKTDIKSTTRYDFVDGNAYQQTSKNQLEFLSF